MWQSKVGAGFSELTYNELTCQVLELSRVKIAMREGLGNLDAVTGLDFRHLQAAKQPRKLDL